MKQSDTCAIRTIHPAFRACRPSLRHANAVCRTAVFFHAHPDDEALLTSGTMAQLAAAGHRVVLIVATAGEAGLAAEAMHGNGGLGSRRLGELHASAQALGVARMVLLGYADSGLAGEPTPTPPAGEPQRFADADVDEVAERVAEVLVREQASALTSYDANGGYGHPDHVAVHRAGARAAALAGTPLLLEATVPRDRLLSAARRINRLLPRSRRIDLDPWERVYSASAEVTHAIDVRAQSAARRASMRAHASQRTSDAGGPRTLGVFSRVPPPLFGWVFGREWYRQPGLSPGTHRYRGFFDTL